MNKKIKTITCIVILFALFVASAIFIFFPKDKTNGKSKNTREDKLAEKVKNDTPSDKLDKDGNPVDLYDKVRYLSKEQFFSSQVRNKGDVVKFYAIGYATDGFEKVYPGAMGFSITDVRKIPYSEDETTLEIDYEYINYSDKMFAYMSASGIELGIADSEGHAYEDTHLIKRGYPYNGDTYRGDYLFRHIDSTVYYLSPAISSEVVINANDKIQITRTYQVKNEIIDDVNLAVTMSETVKPSGKAMSYSNEGFLIYINK